MIRPLFDPAEYDARRAAARRAAEEGGLVGLLVCSRGGGSLDRYADVLYLANYYSAFPYIPDHPENWSGRAHPFLLLPVEGEERLVIDTPAGPEIALPKERIRSAAMVIEAVTEEMRTAGLARGRVGLVGADVLPARSYRMLCDALPEVEWVDAQGLLNRLRARKSPAEIERLRRASELGSRVMDAMMAAAVPGVCHGEIVAAGMQVLLPAGGQLYNSFMASGRGGPDPKRVGAPFPTWAAQERVTEGDWLRLGISGVLDGYVFDLSRSRPIGPPSNRQIELFEAAIEIVEAGIAAVKPGARAHDVAEAAFAKEKALGLELGSAFSGIGHGVGLGWDDPWLTLGNEDAIEPGMVLCLERTVKADGYLGDFEETVVVTDRGAEKITDARIRYW